MQLSLYRAERPEVFEDIIGQKHIVRILQNQIKNNSVSQAYLFTGTHGTGKTSTARILAKAVNCEGPGATTGEGPVPCGECENCRAIKEGRFVDVIELDAASNNKVEDLRALIDLVKYPPTIGRYKVYIIDEVHMLTQQAENAFLKTLEEPPEYAIFILATTDPQKVRDTIRSRCMQLNFKRVSEDELIEGMGRICERNDVTATQDALRVIASQADGSVRDALSILEQCMAAGDTHLDRQLVLDCTGAAGEEFFLDLTDSVLDGRVGDAIVLIDQVVSEGKDARQLMKDWLAHYRNLLVCRFVRDASRVIGASSENIDRLRQQAVKSETQDIDRAIRMLSEYINLGRYSDKPRILMETAAVRLASESAGDVVAASVIAAPPTATRAVNFNQTAGAVRTAPVAEETGVAAATAQMSQEAAPKPQAAAPTAEAAAPSADSMWRSIVTSISRTDTSFETFVGRNSQGESWSDNELVVRVKKNKMKLAEPLTDTIEKVARALYGENTIVTLKAGTVERTGKTASVETAEPVQAAEDVETAEVQGSDEDDFGNIINDIESVLGVSNINIID